MCLLNRKTDVAKFLLKNKGKTFVWAYKVLKRGKEFTGWTYETGWYGTLVPTPEYRYNGSLSAPYRKTPYKAGWNRSNSEVTRPVMNNMSISRGIHVLLTKKDAESFKNNITEATVVRVKCRIMDLIGVNYSYGEAVFKRVYLPHTEVEKSKS